MKMATKRSLSRQESNSKAKKTNTVEKGTSQDVDVKNQVEKEDEKSTEKQLFPFKNHDFQHSGAVKSGKKKTWKSLRQVAQMERSLAPPDATTYLSIESPPCIKPAKKYSDISGQVAKYTDPETGLYYADAAEYKQIKRLPADIVQGYLALRGATGNRL